LPDPDSNFRLRIAIQKARAENMPNENIKRALDRAGSEGGGGNYDEIYYEGYGPNGIALIVKALTDNRNRTVGEVRAVFTRGGGTMGESGSVAFLFDQVGQITVKTKGADVDELTLQAIDAGAQDIRTDNAEAEEDPSIDVITVPTELKMALPEADTLKAMRLIERLEDLDDVQEVYSNLEVSEEIMAQV